MSVAKALRHHVSVQPFEQWERDNLRALAEQQRDDPARSAIQPMVHSETLRWDASLCKVEAQRDELRRHLKALQDVAEAAAAMGGEGEMMMKYGKRDANHNDIRDAARRMGATVIDTPG